VDFVVRKPDAVVVGVIEDAALEPLWPGLAHRGRVRLAYKVYRAFRIFAPPQAVMAGLVPAIQVPPDRVERPGSPGQAQR
jgi:hypothetical protein